MSRFSSWAKGTKVKESNGHPSDVVMPMDYKEFNKMMGDQRTLTGVLSEAIVVLDLAKQGFEIALPVMKSPSFDIVAVSSGEAYLIQVKTMERGSRVYIPTGSHYSGGKQYATGRKLKRKYKGGEFHFLAGVDRIDETVYYVPVGLMDFTTNKYKLTAEDKINFRTIQKALDSIAE